MAKAKTKSWLNVTFESSIDQEETQSPSKKTKSKGIIGQFIALATIPMVLVLGNSMLIPILPQMVTELGITKAQSSFIITLFSLTAAIVIPIAGFLSDRFSRKAVIIPSLIIYGLAGVLAGFGAVWNSYTIIIIARAIQGIGAAGTGPISLALVGDMYQGATQSKALGLIEASNGAGKVISPIIGALFALIIWYAAFFAFPIFCLLSIIAVVWVIKEPKKATKPKKLKPYISDIKSIIKEKGKWLLPAFLAGSLALFTLFGVLFYLSNILEEPPYSLKGVIKGLVLAIPLLGMVITSYVTGSKIKKNGVLMRWLMNIGLIIMTVSLGLTLFFFKNVYIFIGLLTLSSIGTGLLLPCLNTMITGTVEKSERGMITSLYSSLRFLGVALGPPLFGWMMEKSDKIIFITVSSLALGTLVMVFFLIKPEAEVQ
ncbi:MFS transporter [Paenibacillus psychroresistens]|uniref:MFS transporter n=1 Tax=Paenibacillus psychroresistens TaxID=1778678 RepID=A0A6B8RPK2_9BACL|nr:MFS transporter [Paenibacillus psychroresistens]QGQ97433.1 MFS transporter [Paenibacillus psychroresistens]